MSTPTHPDWQDISAAMERALGYTDAVGLSDGTHRPAATVEDLDPSEHIRFELAASGYEPADTYADMFTASGHRRPSAATIAHFAARRWDAVRHNGDTITFARWDTGDNTAHILTTTNAGTISSEATFDLGRIGRRAFLTVAALRP